MGGHHRLLVVGIAVLTVTAATLGAVAVATVPAPEDGAAGTADRTRTLATRVTVDGRINTSDGAPAANDTLRFKGVAGTEDFQSTGTDADGGFAVGLVDGGVYHVGYHQDNRSSASDVAYPTDGWPDLFAVANLTASSGATLNRTLPSAYGLNVTVVNGSGAPVENATVEVSHRANDAVAGTSLPTNARGLMEHPEGDGPGLEVRGDVTVEAVPPSGSGLVGNHTEFDVRSPRNGTVVLHPAVNVSGRIDEADGTPAASDRLEWNGRDVEHGAGNRTDARGRFSARLAENRSYEVEYRQDDPENDTDVAYPKDGSVDVYSFGAVSYGSNASGISRTLPAGHDLTVTVVNESGVPVSGARVHVAHHADVPNTEDDAHAHVEGPTNGSGDLVHPESDGPGFEVNGTVHVHVEPPDGSGLSENGTTVEVTGDRHLSLVLHPTVNVSGRINESDGDPAIRDHLSWHGEDVRHGADNVTNDRGEFSTDLVENATYAVAYRQDDPRSSSDTAFPKDGSVDVQALGVVEVGTADVTDAGETLPVGHNLTVRVVNASGAPVEGATVHVVSFEPGVEAHVEGPTNGSGDLVHPESDGPGFEVNGTVHVHVEPPDGSGLSENGTELTVTGDTHVRLVLHGAVSVTGRLNESDGTPAARDLIRWDGIEGTDGGAGNVTDARGRFSAELIENGTYEVGYRQDDPETAGDVAFPTDRSPDVYTLGLLEATGDVHRTETLPEAYGLNVTVVNESGAPVEGAAVHVVHVVEASGLRLETGIEARTNAAGLMEHPESDGPGFDVVGDVAVHVEPPAGSGLSGNFTELTVSSPTNVTLVLHETVRVSGRLNESDGTPAANDLLEWHGRDVEDGFENVTDAEGRFSARLVENRSYAVAYRQDDPESDTDVAFPKDGSVDVFTPGVVSFGSNVSGISRTLPAGHDLTVTVVNESGVPVSGARVHVAHHVDVPGTGEGAHAHVEGPTNGSGDLVHPESDGPGFEVNGTVHVHVEPPGGSRLSDNGTTVDVQGDTHLTITLHPTVTISGSLTFADGTPVDDWKVMADGGGDHIAAFTSNGEFSLMVPPNTTYNLKYEQFNGDGIESWPRDRRPDIHAIDTVPVGSTNETLGKYQLPKAYLLNVTVVDPTGDPIENADVFVRQFANGAHSGNDAVTNANGSARWVGNDQVGLELRGDVRISVRGPPGYGSNVTELTVTGNRSLLITLQPTVIVSGHLLESDGGPAAADFLEASPVNDSTGFEIDQTATDGAFSLELVANKTYGMRGFQLNETADHLGERDGTVDVYAIDRESFASDTDLGNTSLPTGHVVNVTVVDESGSPVANASITVTHTNDTTGATARITGNPTTEDGLLVAKAIPGIGISRSDVPGLELRGNVTFEIRPPENPRFVERTYVRNVTVDADTTIQVTLDEITNVSGQLNESDGDPAAHDFVGAKRAGEPLPESGDFTDAAGRFGFTIEKNTAYVIVYGQFNETAEHFGVRDGSVDVWPLEETNAPTDVDLGSRTLPAGHVLNVTVVDGDGDSVENASVTLGLENAVTGAETTSPSISTHSDGMIYPPLNDVTPGLELNGSVDVNVTPPDDPRFVEKTYARRPNVTNDTSITIQLEEVAHAFVREYTVCPRTVEVDEEVRINATVENPTTTDNSTTVTFLVDGQVAAIRNVTVPAGGTVHETFTTDFSTLGTHNVTVNDLDPTDVTVGGTIALGDVTGEPGENVTVTLRAADVGRIAGYQANVTFNASVVRVVNVTGAGDFPDPVTNVRNDAGWVFLAQSRPTGTNDTRLAAVTLHVAANGSASAALSFVEADTKLTDAEGTTIPIANYDDGSVTARTCAPGDANGDGSVSSGDATITLRDVVGLSVPGSFSADCADVNGDGSLTSGDATLILRIVVGLPI